MNPSVGSQINVTVTSSGNPTPLLTYQWLRNGSNINGQTNNLYTVNTDDINYGISVRVTATNEAGSVSSTSSSTNPVPSPSVPPQITGANITGTVWVGNDLYAGYASFTQGSPAATLSYQWKRNGVSIAGANNSSYKIQSSDAGSQISVMITATNVAGSDFSESSPTSVVPNPSYNFQIGGSEAGNQSFFIPSSVYGQTFTIPNGKYGNIDSIFIGGTAAEEEVCSTYVRLKVYDVADISSRTLLATSKVDDFIDFPAGGYCYGGGILELDTPVQVVPGQSLYYELTTSAGSPVFQVYATYGVDPYPFGSPYRNGVLETNYDVSSTIYMTLSAP